MSEFGVEDLTDDDRGYAGSRYRDAVDAFFANPYQRVWGESIAVSRELVTLG